MKYKFRRREKVERIVEIIRADGSVYTIYDVKQLKVYESKLVIIAENKTVIIKLAVGEVYTASSSVYVTTGNVSNSNNNNNIGNGRRRYNARGFY